MWRTGWQWLTRLAARLAGRRAPGLRAHPPLAGDRDERRMEHALFEAGTLHAGSRADTPPQGEPTGAADPQDTRSGVHP